MDKQVVSTLKLTHFRNFTQKEIVFDEDVTLVCGDNGQGKTNIIESLAFLSTGRSFRAKTLSDCVQHSQDVAHIEATILIDDEQATLCSRIVSSNGTYAKRASTQYEKNGVKKRKNDFVGLLKTVVFRPEDLEIITDGPSFRRDFLDDVLVQIDSVYRWSLHEYGKALKHRNMLILQLRDGVVTRKDFFFWDSILIKHGDVLTRARKKFCLSMKESVDFPLHCELEYKESVMSLERLREYAMVEVAAGKTLVGPHRDDFLIRMQDEKKELFDVARFGSRGQQRMSVLWLKVCALATIESCTKQTPILLLDDIFSELDEKNRELVLRLFPGRQVIMTSAESLEMLPKECSKANLLTLKDFVLEV